MKGILFALCLVVVLVVTMGCDEGGAVSGIGERGEGGGFVWKPRSESDGRLVVLLPSQYRGNVSSAHIANANGGVVEVGRFAGDSHNGNRPHYRFAQSGAAYGADIFVVADLTEGGNVHWPIANGANRQEY